MNKLIIIIFLSISKFFSLHAQYLSYHETVLFGKKYFVNDHKVTSKQFVKELGKDKEAYSIYLKYKKADNVSKIFNAGQWIMVALQVNEAFDNDLDYGYAYLGCNLLLGIGTVYWKNQSKNLLRKSVKNYNINNSNWSTSFEYLKSPEKIIGLSCVF